MNRKVKVDTFCIIHSDPVVPSRHLSFLANCPDPVKPLVLPDYCNVARAALFICQFLTECGSTDDRFVTCFTGHVEVVDMKVTVCRDAVKGKCARPLCKYYHIPIALPPANEMAAQLENKGQFSVTPSAAIVAAAAGQLRTSVMVSSGNPNRMLCQ
jgi:hypothetical protein